MSRPTILRYVGHSRRRIAQAPMADSRPVVFDEFQVGDDNHPRLHRTLTAFDIAPAALTMAASERTRDQGTRLDKASVFVST
jgi:hypothetical protein